MIGHYHIIVLGWCINTTFYTRRKYNHVVKFRRIIRVLTATYALGVDLFLGYQTN